MKVQECLDAFKDFKNLSDSKKYKLKKAMRKVKLLSEDKTNTKTAKSVNARSDIRSYILHLSPSTQAFKYLGRRGTLCPMASKGCHEACLNTAGRGKFDTVQNARLRKSLYFILMRSDFIEHLFSEIEKLRKKAAKDGVQLAIRPNGTSDIRWDFMRDKDGLNIFERFPDVKFYDYTKVLKYLDAASNYSNYHLTFSASESNENECLKALSKGFNVAMVFDEIPRHYKGYKCINGDNHDLRFLDDGESGAIVALKAKGKAVNDTSGFVRKVKQKQNVA